MVKRKERGVPVYKAVFLTSMAETRGSAPIYGLTKYTYQHTASSSHVALDSRGSRVLLPIKESPHTAAFFDEATAWLWIQERAQQHIAQLLGRVEAMRDIRAKAWEKAQAINEVADEN